MKTCAGCVEQETDPALTMARNTISPPGVGNTEIAGEIDVSGGVGVRQRRFITAGRMASRQTIGQVDPLLKHDQRQASGTYHSRMMIRS